MVVQTQKGKLYIIDFEIIERQDTNSLQSAWMYRPFSLYPKLHYSRRQPHPQPHPSCATDCSIGAKGEIKKNGMNGLSMANNRSAHTKWKRDESMFTLFCVENSIRS